MPTPSTWSKRTPISRINSCPHLALKVLRLLFHEIASLTPLVTALRLSRSHTSLCTHFTNHLARCLTTLLEKHISPANISTFRVLLRETRAVISGSTALHFVLRDNHWRPGDFDLYAPFGTGWAVVQWLVVTEGYKLVSDGSKSFIRRPKPIQVQLEPCDWLTDIDIDHIPQAQPPRLHGYSTNSPHIYRVFKLYKPFSNPQSSIDVIESAKPSFLPPITRFHSTLVMNYITADSVVVLYPSLTFKREGILQFRDRPALESYDDPTQQVNVASTNPTVAQRSDVYIEKYIARGFNLYSRPEDLGRPCKAACPALIRELKEGVDQWALEVKFAVATNETGGTDKRKQSPVPGENFHGLENLPVDVAPSSYISPHTPLNVQHFVPAASSYSDPNSRILSNSTSSISPHSLSSPWSSTLASLIHSSSSCSDPDNINAGSISQCPPRVKPSSPVASRLPIRPPLPPTSWSLESPPKLNPSSATRSYHTSNQKHTCINQFCPLRGLRYIHTSQLGALAEYWSMIGV